MTGLDGAADELYAIAPADLDEFARRRTALAAGLKQAGDKDAARQVGSLRKPVLAAAIVNTLVRSEAAELAELSELGAALRDAHRHLRGSELRELSERRQQLLTRLTDLGRSVAGRPVGDPVLDQLRATFEAAIADEAAETAVRSGRLTAALSYSGFGEVDLADAVALPPRLTVVPDLANDNAPSRSKKSNKEGAKPARGAAAEPDEPVPSGPDPVELRRATQALERAESAAAAAQRSVQEAADELAAADDAEREIDERIRRLKRELAEARDAATAAASASSAAEREHGRRVRAGERAEQARARAQADLDSLT